LLFLIKCRFWSDEWSEFGLLLFAHRLFV
jgi:hypothetical protein